MQTCNLPIPEGKLMSELLFALAHILVITDLRRLRLDFFTHGPVPLTVGSNSRLEIDRPISIYISIKFISATL